jgi:3-methyladenine DNA glycosylase AlkC
MAYKKLKLWFDEDLAIMLSDKIRKHYPGFDDRRFIREISGGIDKLELKGRIELIADVLKAKLPSDYPQAITLLQKILGPENDKETGMFTEGYWLMPVAKYVEKYGLGHFSISMEVIREITKRHTGEYCIRPFILEYPQKTLTMMKKWSLDSNVHLRRLSSEGLRPRLPWARKLEQFIKDPKPILSILDNLKDDHSKFVQKSVANNLNDILKDNYKIGIETIKNWSKGASRNRCWILKHALRNQIKKQNAEALKIVENLIQANTGPKTPITKARNKKE